jgi:hypothetical protein
MRETLVHLNRLGSVYAYNNYTIEQFDNRWYVFDGVQWVADFRTLSQVRLWLSDMELIGE